MTSAWTPKFTESRLGRFAIGGVSRFRRIECPDVLSATGNPNMSQEFASYFVFMDALQTNRMRLIDCSVLLVLAVRRLAEVQPTIVRSIVVLMVNVWRILSGSHLPNNPVRVDLATIQPNLNTTVLCNPAGRSSGPCRVPLVANPLRLEVMDRSHLPPKRSVLRVIIEALAQILCVWQRLVSHAVLLGGRWLEATIPVKQGRGLAFLTPASHGFQREGVAS